jgi:hypothetical protein
MKACPGTVDHGLIGGKGGGGGVSTTLSKNLGPFMQTNQEVRHKVKHPDS